MDSGEEAALIVFLVLLSMVALFFICCYHHGKVVHPVLKWVYYKRKGLLVKRCEQDNMEVRRVETAMMSRMQIHEKTWRQELDDGQRPVLVFCVNASRIGTDIESALRGIHGSRVVLVVVLHCKNISALRGDLSDDDYLLDEELRGRITGIAHFAFTDREGVYSCRQNEDGFRKLSNHLKSV